MDDHGVSDPLGPRFAVLGPLLVRGASGPVAVSGGRQRIALTTLLLRANQVVPLDDLIDNLWPDQPPATARDQVVNVMSGLRRLLGAAGGQAARNSLVTQPSGYLLRIREDELDVGRLEALTRDADACSAAGRLPGAVAALRAALGLYRGPVLVDVPGRFAVAEVRRLEELRLAVVERLMETEFALGRHRDVVPELARLVERHPLRERLRGQFMVALHAAGRTADALAAYRAGQRLLAQALGLDPSAELRRLEQEIRADPAGGATRTGPASGEPDARLAVPAQLPPDLTDFVGRTDEVAAIRRALGAAEPAGVGTAVPVVVVSGPPGIGKSALVVRVGHLERANFPDGQLHVTPGPGGYADTSAVLSRMFAALGVPRNVIPDDVPGQVRLYRSVTAPRRMLIVLEDVAAAPHVRPLLPGGAGCAVLITSRRPLAGLAGVHRVRLDALSETDSLALLAATAGPRVSADPAAARRIADLCGRLPLALRAAGTKVAHSDRLPGECADRLADPAVRLDELCTGDLDVRAVIESGLDELPPELLRTAQRLAALDAPLLPLWTVGAVLGVGWARGEELADQLVEWEILEYLPPDPPAQPRYRFRELVKLCLRGLEHRRPPTEPGSGGSDRDHAGRVRSERLLGA